MFVVFICICKVVSWLVYYIKISFRYAIVVSYQVSMPIHLLDHCLDFLFCEDCIDNSTFRM